MLTRDYILKVRRMMEQTRGYSTGAYDTSHPDYYQNQSLSPPAIHKKHKTRRKTIKLRLEYVVDEITGDVRIAQK